ncbi:MAG: protein-tyrosine-phosphatase [Bacteroidota bacterium]
MYIRLKKLADTLIQEFDTISMERKKILNELASFIQQKKDSNEPIQLVYICTHNSRRSHFGQIAGALAANYFHINQVSTFSGGTEATAFHPNAIQALRTLGFEISTTQLEQANPIYKVSFGEDLYTTCFSKIYKDEVNPKQHFAAIMTCSDADENCPLIPGVSLRIGTTYEDPKKSDGTALQEQTYQDRFKQILTETLYAFSLVKS